MFAITGITGKVGGALAEELLTRGATVRAVVRDRAKAQRWAARGCDVAQADMNQPDRLASAFAGADGVFILPPSDFDPAPGYPEARVIIDAVAAALAAAKPKRIVCLSTIGADASQDNLLTQRTLMEQALGALDLPITFLRPGWFMENAAWDVASARDEGIIRSFLQPADRAIPMIATRDIGRVAADLLLQEGTAPRVVELEGADRVSPNDVAAAFATVLGRPVRVAIVPRADWQGLFVAQGMTNPMPRIRMLDGFNEGWIDFADNGRSALKGTTPLVDVIAKLVKTVAD